MGYIGAMANGLTVPNQQPTPGAVAASPPPPIMAINGIVPVIPMSQILDEQKRAAEARQQQPMITGLAGHVRKCYEAAWRAKNNGTSSGVSIQHRLEQAVRQRRGEYDPDVMAEIRKSGGSEIYMMLTANKCRAAASWVKDVMMGTKDQPPWDVEPTSNPDLSPMDIQEVIQEATQEAMALETQIGMGAIQVSQMRQLIQRIHDRKISEMKDQAEKLMDRMRSKMQDQLQEGGFYVALDQFIDDLATFPFAIIKGPVPRKRKVLQWTPVAPAPQLPPPGGMPQGQPGAPPQMQQRQPMDFKPTLKDVIQLEWERVDPFRSYWAPHATNIDDGFFIEHHELTRSDLEAMIGIEGYDDDAIRGVLNEYGTVGLHTWLLMDQQAIANAQGKPLTSLYDNPEATIDALQFWGGVQGKMLVEWGMDEAQVPDLLKEYDCEVWTIGRWVIKATLNANPCGDKPYYKTSYEKIPGNWAGNGVPDLVRDAQRMCNAAGRALHNNLGIASGPLVWMNVERMPQGEDLTQIYPWRIFQGTSSPYGIADKGIEFFQPQSNAQELMTVYEKFSALADEYSGVPRYMTGDAPAGGAGRTASGMSMLMTNAGKNIKQVIGNIDMDVTRPLMERLYYNNMMYSDDPFLKGDVRVVARGVNTLVAKEQAQVRMNEILNIIGANPILIDIVGEEAVADLLREITKPLNMDIVPDKEVVRARMLMRQQVQALQMVAEAQQAQQPQSTVEFQRDGNGAVQGAKVMGGNRQKLLDHKPTTDNFSPQRQR